MPSSYLQSGDYTIYGVASTTTSADVIKASKLIDGYLSREEGLLYIADNLNNPLYMAAKDPRFTITLQSNISAGNSVSATVTGPVASITVGDVGIIDKTGANDDSVEALLVTSLTKINNTTWTIVFQNVVYSHLSGATIDFGLLIQDEISLPSGRAICKIPKLPLLNIFSGYGRYSYGRRNDCNNYAYAENLLAVVSQFGGQPVWEQWTPSNTMWNSESGELWVPSGMLWANYSQIKIQYVAGYTYTNLPSQIKQACANIINSYADIGMSSGAFKAIQAGGTRIERASGSMNSMSTILDGDTQALLNPFRARLFI
jgi:hypothetical protein